MDMDISSIVDRIIENPEGGTAHLQGAELPGTGYYVGGVVSSLILDQPTSRTDGDIEAFVAYIALDGNIAEYVGWWVDDETGKLYVDATTWHADYDEAERVTRERNEIAFYDIERQREFRPVVVEA